MNTKLKDIFTDIYIHNKWGGRESRSGQGSDNTIEKPLLRHNINKLLHSLHAKSILDIPCGDNNWFLPDLIFDYIGADIVPELVLSRLNMGTFKHWEFQLLDITESPLPKVDVILTRDLFGHLKHKNVFKALNNIKRSGSTYLLTTSFTSVTDNQPFNAKDGGWYPINVCIEPFNLIPIALINERCQEGNGKFRDKCLVLIEVETIKNYEI